MAETALKKPRATTLVVDLKDLKQPWNEWCRARGVTPSEAVRRVLGHLVAGTSEAAMSRPPSGEAGEDVRRRVEVRFSTEDYAALMDAANREGMAVSRWLNALVTVYLGDEVPLGRDDVDALARSNQLLLALGRSVNKIAYNIGEQIDADELTLGQLEFVLNFLKEHTQAVSAVIHANTKRWRR